jgi:preprotein translocase subunit SecE
MKESEKILLSGYHIKHIFDELNKTKYKSFKYNTLSAKLHYMKTLHNLKFSENKNMEWPKKKRIIYTVFGISSIVTIFGCFIMGISVPA